MFGGLAKVLAVQLIGAVDEVHLHGSNLQGKQCGYSANAEKGAKTANQTWIYTCPNSGNPETCAGTSKLRCLVIGTI